MFDAANTDGESALLSPGIGVGGHCTPVYPYFLIHDAARRDVDVSIVATSRDVNDAQPDRAAERLAQHLGGLDGVPVGILGFGFRPEVKEHICSPTFLLEAALRVARRGRARARPAVHRRRAPRARLHAVHPDADDFTPTALVLSTGHEAFKDAGALPGSPRAASSVVVDGRRFWDPETVAAAGLDYLGTGRSDTPGHVGV